MVQVFFIYLHLRSEEALNEGYGVKYGYISLGKELGPDVEMGVGKELGFLCLPW